MAKKKESMYLLKNILARVMTKRRETCYGQQLIVLIMYTPTLTNSV
jgi:hypothetical protein